MTPAASGVRAARRPDPDRPWYDHAASLVPRDAGRFIDLGCGHGELLGREDVPRGGFGLDRDAASLRASRDGVGSGAGTGPEASSDARLVLADLARPLPFVDATFDGACLVEVIEHLTQAEALVREIRRILRPDGWLVLTTPNVVHLTYRIRALTGHPPKQEGYHFRFFTRATLAGLLETEGFRIEATASYGKQALATKLARLAAGSANRRRKVHYRVPTALEPLLARHFVWRLRRY